MSFEYVLKAPPDAPEALSRALQGVVRFSAAAGRLDAGLRALHGGRLSARPERRRKDAAGVPHALPPLSFGNDAFAGRIAYCA
jgi:hypothetical protein